MPYIGSQIAGAFLAILILKLLFPTNQNLEATLPAGSSLQSFVLELVLTFILMMVILTVLQGSKQIKPFAGIAIGGMVLLGAMFTRSNCGASMNPARSVAPAMVSGNIEDVWIYIAAPIVGVSIAVWTSKVLNKME